MTTAEATPTDKTEQKSNGAAAEAAKSEPVKQEAKAEPAKAEAAEPEAEGGKAEQDWRDVAAAGDEKFRQRLERFNDPAEFARSYRELERRLNTAGKVSVPKADASAEEIAAFREQTKGTILEAPADAAGYGELKIALPDGVEEIPDVAKPYQAKVMEVFAGDLNKEQMRKAHQLVVDLALTAEQAESAVQESARSKAEADLRKLWGPDFEKNIKIANAGANYYARAAGISDPLELTGIQLRDGTMLGNHPLWARFAAKIGRERVVEDPDFLLAEDNPQGALANIDAQIAELTKLRNSRNPRDRAEYDRRIASGDLARLTSAKAAATRGR